MGQPHRARWLVAVALLSAAMPLLAVSESSLQGRILDKDGSPLPGVTLVLRNGTLAVAEVGTVSNAKGEYSFRHLPPGAGYRLSASLPLHATVEFTDVTLTSSVATTLDITLRP
ncbi:MAG TPA: carboxypeptidase-like regulatory domain-containing protein, partial [Candidatus Polarisedimenticolia bacterium]|nr:carboxypeptidase-like regulatory domain-containing protein [Candidatus Polarisedimenticolia bacterium]